ncbi:hypothetical protein ACFQO7_21550 [Catellatospora aurea]|uniref:Lipoprotein n=1 Tax=Catellatospora aurea TaxID=1337874 RepID=A0ABW2GYQ6_9ACTN
MPGVINSRGIGLALVAAGLVSACGVIGPVDDGTASERAVRNYLDALVQGDHAAAHALICTDETGVERGEFDAAEQANPVRSYEIESSVAWSSPVDGHGFGYRVRVTRTAGNPVVQEIRTQGDRDICIQHGNIRNL